MNFTGSPATYSRDCAYSSPAPWKTDSSWPKFRLLARCLTVTSNCRASTGSWLSLTLRRMRWWESAQIREDRLQHLRAGMAGGRGFVADADAMQHDVFGEIEQ